MFPESCFLVLLSYRAQKSVFAFPACNLPVDNGRASIDVTFANLTTHDSKVYGDLLLLEGIAKDDNREKLVLGTTLTRVQATGQLTYFENGGLGLKWEKVPYKGEIEFK